MIYPAISTCSDMVFVCLSPFSRWILWRSPATHSTDGGTTEGGYFVEYVTAKNMVEAKRILRAELQAAGYKNIKLDVIEA